MEQTAQEVTGRVAVPSASPSAPHSAHWLYAYYESCPNEVLEADLEEADRWALFTARCLTERLNLATAALARRLLVRTALASFDVGYE